LTQPNVSLVFSELGLGVTSFESLQTAEDILQFYYFLTKFLISYTDFQPNGCIFVPWFWLLQYNCSLCNDKSLIRFQEQPQVCIYSKVDILLSITIICLHYPIVLCFLLMKGLRIRIWSDNQCLVYRNYPASINFTVRSLIIYLQ